MMLKKEMPSILIVEDNPVQQIVMRMLSEKLGYTADFVSSSEETLDALRACTTCYDAILMVWKLAGIDGGQCTKMIRELEAPTNRRTPIIAIAAYAKAGDREACLAADTDDYLSKPFTADQFRGILLRWTYNASRPNLKLLPDYKSDQPGCGRL